MHNDDETAKEGLQESSRERDGPGRVVDPSDAVTGLGLVFGVVGALVGVVAAVFVSPGFSAALIGYCLLAAFAGGSAGVVTGGMFGAIFAVWRVSLSSDTSLIAA